MHFASSKSPETGGFNVRYACGRSLPSVPGNPGRLCRRNHHRQQSKRDHFSKLHDPGPDRDFQMDVRASDLPHRLDAPALQVGARSLPTARQSMTEIKETVWWMLVILGVAAFAYDLVWYSGMVAIHL